MIAPIRLQDVYSLVQQMIQSPADQVRLASQLRSMVRNLPPERSELVSRYAFHRAGLWSYVANFFDVDPDREPPLEVIRIPHDSWIRSVHAFALVQTSYLYEAQFGFEQASVQRTFLERATGDNWRGMFEVNWRINASQGFISTGTGELLAPATMVTGNGKCSAAMDWRLQQEDTIEVRVRNRVNAILTTGPNPRQVAIERTIPWICVTFWAEELPEP